MRELVERSLGVAREPTTTFPGEATADKNLH
jgi:hypothetical protein